jgi:hypothetical protein
MSTARDDGWPAALTVASTNALGSSMSTDATPLCDDDAHAVEERRSSPGS